MEIKTLATVDNIIPLSNTIIELILQPQHYIAYQAGQYLQIKVQEEYLSYSIANAPLGSHKYELHIRHEGGNPYEQPLFAQIKKEGQVEICLPFGDCYLNKLTQEKPILFLAGGTGFAPIKAMIEQLLATGDQRAFELYWGARSQSDLYLDSQVKLWQNHTPLFHYFSLFPSTSNRENILSLVCDRHAEDLNHYEIILAGPFDMVYALRDHLVALGVKESQLYSDAFSFEHLGD